MVSPKILSLPPDELDKAIRTNSYWLALYRDDRSQGGEIDDKTMVNGVKRTEFRLHYGHYSLGCMTFEKSSDFREMMLSLAKTPAIYINKKGEKVEKDSLGSIQVYGKLIIPDPIPQIPISSRNPPQRRN